MDRAELVVKLQTAQINLEQEQERRRRLEAKVDSFTRQRQTSPEGMEDLKVKLNNIEASEARERQAGSKLREDLSQLQKNNEDLEARMKQVLTKLKQGVWLPLRLNNTGFDFLTAISHATTRIIINKGIQPNSVLNI